MCNYEIYEFYQQSIKGGQVVWSPLDFGFITNAKDLPAIEWSKQLDIINNSPTWVKQQINAYKPKDASAIDLRVNNITIWTSDDATVFYTAILQMLDCFLYRGKDAPSAGVNFLRVTTNSIGELWQTSDGRQYLTDIYILYSSIYSKLNEAIEEEEVCNLFEVAGKTYVLPYWAVEDFANSQLDYLLKNPEILTFRQGVEALSIEYAHSLERQSAEKGNPVKKAAYINEVSGLLAALSVEVRLVGVLPKNTPAIKSKYKKEQQFEYIGDNFARELYETKSPTPEKEAEWVKRFSERKNIFSKISLKEAQRVVFFLTLSCFNYTNTLSTSNYLPSPQQVPKLRQKQKHP